MSYSIGRSTLVVAMNIATKRSWGEEDGRTETGDVPLKRTKQMVQEEWTNITHTRTLNYIAYISPYKFFPLKGSSRSMWQQLVAIGIAFMV
jgi:hypothetical protein